MSCQRDFIVLVPEEFLVYDILELGAQQNISQLRGLYSEYLILVMLLSIFFSFHLSKNRCVRHFDDRLFKHNCLEMKDYAIVLSNSLQTLENLVISSV